MGKKRIWLIILVVAITFFVPVFRTLAFSKWFSPDDGSSHNTTTWWEFWTVWDAHANWFTFIDAWEGELRGQPGRNINEFYCGIISWDSGLPGKYPEHDEDDYTIGSYDVHKLVPGQWYYSWMWLYPCYYQPSPFPAIFESEWCRDFGFLEDPIPVDNEQKYYSIPGSIYW
jgi:hypothetical protein